MRAVAGRQKQVAPRAIKIPTEIMRQRLSSLVLTRMHAVLGVKHIAGEKVFKANKLLPENNEEDVTLSFYMSI